MMSGYAKKRRHFDYFIAITYASLKETETTLDWLETASKKQEAELNWVQQEPEFAALHKHSRYLILANKMRSGNKTGLF